MKISRTSIQTSSNIKSGMYTSRFFLGLTFVCCCLFNLISGDIRAQTDNGPASIDMKAITWKSNVELVQTLSSEIAKVDEMISPDLQPVDQSIYKAYKRMLTYIQQHIQNNLEVEEAIAKGYKQVINEAPKDPELSKLPENVLGTYLPAVVEMLAAVPVPVAQPR